MPKQAVTPNISWEDENVIDLSADNIDFEQLKKLSQASVQKELEKHQQESPRRPVIQELQSVDFTGKQDMRQFEGFDRSDETKNEPIEKTSADVDKSNDKDLREIGLPNDTSNLEQITLEMQKLNLGSEDFSFGFLGKFKDYFQNLKVFREYTGRGGH